MGDFIWPDMARRAAVLELAMSLAVSVLLLLNAGFAMIEGATDQKEIHLYKANERFDIIGGLWWTWVVIGSYALLTGLQFWTSSKLLSATVTERDLYKALGKVRIWLNMTVIFVVMQVVVVTHDILTTGCADWGQNQKSVLLQIAFLILRGMFMFSVYKFRKELETALVLDVEACSWIHLSEQGFRRVIY